MVFQKLNQLVRNQFYIVMLVIIDLFNLQLPFVLTNPLIASFKWPSYIHELEYSLSFLSGISQDSAYFLSHRTILHAVDLPLTNDRATLRDIFRRLGLDLEGVGIEKIAESLYIGSKNYQKVKA